MLRIALASRRSSQTEWKEESLKTEQKWSLQVSDPLSLLFIADESDLNSSSSQQRSVTRNPMDDRE